MNHQRLSGVVKALFCCILCPYGEYSVSNAPQMALNDPPKSIRHQRPTSSYPPGVPADSYSGNALLIASANSSASVWICFLSSPSSITRARGSVPE